MYWFTVWMSAGPALAIAAIAINLFLLHLPIVALVFGLLQLAVAIYAFLCTYSLYRIIKAENREDGVSGNVEMEN